MADYNNNLLNKILITSALDKLSQKERETILLWASGFALQQIADIIGPKYDNRTKETPLGSRAMGVRIRKIIKKLQILTHKGT